MPGYNECSIYDANCRLSKCSHPTNKARQQAMAAHPSSQGPEKPVKAPTTGVQAVHGEDGRYSITGLSEDDMYALASALQFTVTGARFDKNTAERKLEVILWDVLPD